MWEKENKYSATFKMGTVLFVVNWKININPLWACDAMLRHRSWTTLAQMMVCWHYLNQCLLSIGEVLWLSLENNFTANAQGTILYMYDE